MSRSAEGLDDLSDHVAGNLVAELKRLRQRELDLLEERRMLRAEVAKLRAEVERHLQDAEKVLGWAVRYLNPIAALSRLRAAIDAARKKEV
jgi:regulator of replication initiation timing